MLDDLRAKWGRCCEALSRRNVALPLVVKNAVVAAVDGTRVTLSFGFLFHFDTAKQAKNLGMITDSVSEIMGQTVTIDCVYEAPKDEIVVEELLEAFGGSVVA